MVGHGHTYLLSKTNKFNYGLLNKVKLFLTKENIEFTVEDKRAPKSKSVELDISDKLKEHGLIPRDHQLRVVETMLQNDRGIVRAATGSGKSLCSALFTAKINKPTIIYVIGLDLLGQFHDLFSKLFNEKIGYIGNGTCDIQRITIASIWSIGRALSLKNVTEDDDGNEKELDTSHKEKIIELLAKAKVHQFDESHVVTTSTINEIYKHIDPEYIYGFSGTPFRDDNSDLLVHSMLGEQIINVSASELIEKDLLAAPLIRFITVPKMTVNSVYTAAYKEYIVENDKRNDLIVDMCKNLISKNYTVLVLFKQIKHGDILFEKLTDAGISFDMLSGHNTLDERNIIKKKIVNKEINLVLSSTIFDIGLDLPELNALVLAGGGKSSIRALQRIRQSNKKISWKEACSCG